MKDGSRSGLLGNWDQIADDIDDMEESACRSGPVAVLTDDDEVTNQVHTDFENAKFSVFRLRKKKKLDMGLLLSICFNYLYF